MDISAELADRLYSIMVDTIHAPNIDYRRWAFVYAITEMHVTEYLIDSKLGIGARFNHKSSPPVVTCGPGQATLDRNAMVKRANTAMANVVSLPKKTNRRKRIAA